MNWGAGRLAADRERVIISFRLTLYAEVKQS